MRSVHTSDGAMSARLLSVSDCMCDAVHMCDRTIYITFHSVLLSCPYLSLIPDLAEASSPEI